MSWTHPAYEAVARLVAARTGLRCPPGREDRTEQAIRRALARACVSSPEEYHDRLEGDDALLDDLVGQLTVGETYFFREPGQFVFLRREVLPDLIRRRGPGHVFRVWSAGCATGEEAYSLAILFEQEGLGEQVRVLATDIAREALARARQARYGEWSLRGAGAAMVRPYLLPRGKAHVLDDRVRRLVRFEYLNLARDVYPSFATDTWGVDLILCRNVLIYLDPPTSERVAGRLFQSLAPGGWLLTASSDPPLQDWAPLATVVTDAGVFYRRPDEEVRSQGSGVRGQESGGRSQGSGVRGEADALAALTPDSCLLTPDSSSETRETTGAGDAVERVRKLAGEDVDEAERVCGAAVAGQPLSAELHYLHAVLRMHQGRDEEAIAALRKVVYLDRSLAVAHFTLGALLGRRGDRPGARSAFRNALALCTARPADEPLPLGDGESTGRLARAAAFQLELLEDAGEVAP